MPTKRESLAEVDLTDAKLEKEFGMGCLHIKMAHLWPLTHFVWKATANFVGATFFCYDLDGWRKNSLVRIEVFRLPRDKEHFDERVEWYTRDRKKRRIRIADGQLFDEKHLHPKAFGVDWEQDSFATSKGHAIRIYRSKKYAVIFRFLIQNGKLLEHPVFKRLVKNLSIHPDQWTRDVPGVIENKKKRKNVEEWALPDEQESEMWQIVGSFMKANKLQKLKTPARLSLIEERIQEIRKQKKTTDDEKFDVAIELGTFIGQLFCWDFQWEWCYLTDANGNEEYCVVSPDRSVAIAPVDWVYNLISNKKRSLNCLLTYNLIDSGRLPPSRAKTYKRLG